MNWNLVSMLHSMSGLARAVVIVLLVMLVLSVGIAIDRSLRYGAARAQSRVFIRQSAEAFSAGKIDAVISIARTAKKSHIAQVVAGGLADFQRAPSIVSEDGTLAVAQRGLDRAVSTIHAEMKRGLGGLATIGSTAPFVGLFGTVLGIMNAFRGTAIPQNQGLSGISTGIAEALVTTALGLLVAVPAVWCYNYFTGKLELFDVEMDNSSMELVNYLTARVERQKPTERP